MIFCDYQLYQYRKINSVAEDNLLKISFSRENYPFSLSNSASRVADNENWVLFNVCNLYQLRCAWLWGWLPVEEVLTFFGILLRVMKILFFFSFFLKFVTVRGARLRAVRDCELCSDKPLHASARRSLFSLLDLASTIVVSRGEEVRDKPGWPTGN